MLKKLVAKASVLVPSIALSGLATSTAYAKMLQCNKQQTRCLTESTDLTIGDRVGIFNTEGELVATGEIKGMKGERRAVKIQQRHGRISKGYNLALLSSKTSDATYTVYREPADLVVGGSFGYGRVSIGEGSPETEFSGYMQWRKWNGIPLIGRVVYTAMEGTVSRYGDFEGIETRPISMKGIGLLGGAAYTLRENKPLGFRGELGLGMMHVSANIDGDAGALENQGYNARIKNGVQPYARWSIGAVMNMDTWRFHGDLSQSLVNEAFTNQIALGASMDLK